MLQIKIPKSEFCLSQIFDCGQAFRFVKMPINDTNEENIDTYFGVAFGKILVFSQFGELLTVHGTSDESLISHYFDLETSYTAIKSELLAQNIEDNYLKTAIETGYGIRILRQEPFETLISFIISQNNNIPRIKSIIERICERFGKPISDNISIIDTNMPKKFYAFPTPSSLYEASEQDLMACGCGFRARYIKSASKWWLDGGDVVLIGGNIDTNKLCMRLCEIVGVGPKVAACSALFGAYRVDAFPVDTWIAKVMAQHYPTGTPLTRSKYAGIAQQYLFYKVRENHEKAKTPSARRF